MQKLLTESQGDFLDGLEAGRRDAAKCHDMSDVHWMQRVVVDNLWSTRPRYASGYCEGFK